MNSLADRDRPLAMILASATGFGSGVRGGNRSFGIDPRHRRHAGSKWSSSGWPLSNSIRSGIRCTTLVKLPVALSGGSNANCDPLAGETRATCPAQLRIREGIDRDLHRLPGLHARKLRLFVVRDNVDIRERHHVEQVAADIDVISRLNLPRSDHTVERGHDPGVAEFEFCGLQCA